jgi:hypothetical protein
MYPNEEMDMFYWMIGDRSLPAQGPKTPAKFGDDQGDLTFGPLILVR